MRPYYDHDGITLYHGDCLRVMAELPGPFDLVFTSPPYNLGSAPWPHLGHWRMPITSVQTLQRAVYGTNLPDLGMTVYFKDEVFLGELLPYVQGVKRLEYDLADKLLDYQI